jgi:hypothetical protein
MTASDADWAAIHPLGDWAQFPKIRAMADALMAPGFVLAKLAINPTCREVDTVDELVALATARERGLRGIEGPR